MLKAIIDAIILMLRGGPMTAQAVNNALAGRAATKGEKLNWQTSIVDLLKVLDLDSSKEARIKLAAELGYSGSAPDGSAEKNEWLHTEVMRRVAQHRM